MDTTALGAIPPTQVQDNNQRPTQVSLSPGVATVGHPATSGISSAGRRGRAATGTHGVGTVDCDNCRTARGPAAFPPNRSHGSEKRRQRGRRVRRTRWLLLRIWRKRGGHGQNPQQAKIQLCQTYAVLSDEKGGAVLKASRRVFVAFSCFAVISCSARSSPTVNISQKNCKNGGAVLREILSVFCRQQRFWCCFYQHIVACTVPSLFSKSIARSYLQAEVSVLFL